MNLTRAIMFAAALMLIGCATVAQPQISLPAPYTSHGVSVVVGGLLRDDAGNVVGISGVATNTTDRDLNFCTVSFDIMNSGLKVTSAAASAPGGLKAGQKWLFQAAFVDSVTFTSVEAGIVTAM
jgi:hypothetical protein